MYRTEDFLDRMAIDPQTGTSVDYTVCAMCLKYAGLTLCNICCAHDRKIPCNSANEPK